MYALSKQNTQKKQKKKTVWSQILKDKRAVGRVQNKIPKGFPDTTHFKTSTHVRMATSQSQPCSWGRETVNRATSNQMGVT